MTIPTERETDILRLYHVEKWRVGTIAAQLGLHHVTVRRVLHQAGVPTPTLTERPSIVDPYLPFIVETLDKYPRLPASRLFHMVKERGYPCGPDHFRAIIARHRPRPQPRRFSGCARSPASKPKSTGHTSARSRSAGRSADSSPS